MSNLIFSSLIVENTEMDGYRKGRPWGKLVKVDSSETVLLLSRECTVGRKKGMFILICIIE